MPRTGERGPNQRRLEGSGFGLRQQKMSATDLTHQQGPGTLLYTNHHGTRCGKSLVKSQADTKSGEQTQ